MSHLAGVDVDAQQAAFFLYTRGSQGPHRTLSVCFTAAAAEVEAGGSLVKCKNTRGEGLDTVQSFSHSMCGCLY